MRSVLIMLALLLSVTLTTSCSGGRFIPIDPIFYDTSINLVLQDLIGGQVPFIFTYDFDFKNIEETEKIEIDFDDGMGYIDVTNACFTWWKAEGPKPYHVYTLPGDYYIGYKFKLKSGKVFESRYLFPVTVLPPDEGDDGA